MRSRASFALSGLVAVTLLVPGGAAALSPQTGAAFGSPPAQAPSIHYQDAQAHAGDSMTFEPGGAVSVPFRPRPGDRWLVGGRLPRPLPIARLSGREILRQATTSAIRQRSALDYLAMFGEPTPGADPSATPDPTPSPEPTADESVLPGPSVEPSATPDPTPSPEPTATIEPTPTPDPWSADDVGLAREIYGYLPYWELHDSSTRLDYTALSTIAYFGVGADSEGRLIRSTSSGNATTNWAGWTSNRMTSIIDEAHRNGVRVVLTVQRFAWTTNQIEDTVALLSSPMARQALAAEIAAAVRDRGADGVNLDFEPIPSGQSANFVALVREVRAALDAQAAGYQLTYAATAYVGNYDVAALAAPGAADAVFIMGYEYRTSRSSRAGSIAPLAGPSYDLAETVDAFVSRSEPSKVILGIPYYGRVWSTESDAVRSRTLTQSSSNGYSKSVMYDSAATLAAQHGRRYDTAEDSAWTAYRWQNCSSCPEVWRELYFDDPESLGAKYDYVNLRDLRGAGMWALGYDGTRPELYAVARDRFRADQVAPRVGIVTLPETTRQESIAVEWIAVDDRSGVAAYDVEVSEDAGAWTAWLTGTTDAAGTYAGSHGHTYAFRVRARDADGNWSDWSSAGVAAVLADELVVGGFATVTVPELLTYPDASADSASVGILAAGDRVALVGGPVTDGSATWWQVTGPLSEWTPVRAGTQEAVWVVGAGEVVQPTSEPSAEPTAEPTPEPSAEPTAEPGAPPAIVPARAPSETRVDVDVAITSVTLQTVEGSRTTLVAPSDTSAVAAPVFSPNGDGSADMLRVGYRLHLGLDTLDLVVRIPDGTALGSLSLPGRTHGDHVFDWDGRLNGLTVPDGVVVLQVTGVRDGTTYSVPDEDSSVDSVADALAAVVDTLAPSLDGPHLDRSALSPNGESLDITGQVGADALGWSLEVEGPAVVVRSFVGAAPSVAVAWDGRDAAGAPVPDGTYTVRLRTVDQAGNAAEQSAIVAVDGTAPVAGLTTTIAGFVTGSTPGSFSPDGDRVSDVASIAWTASERSAAVLEISGPEGTGGVVRTVGFSPRTGGSFTWNGRDGSNASVPDGVYTLALRTTDGPGNASFTTGSLVVDRTLGFVTASPVVWHPSDGDRLASTSTFRFRLSASATTWLRVRSASGTVVRTAWIRQARASGQHAWRWDGRDRYGALVPDGRYTLEVVAMRSGVKRIARLTTTLGGFEINLSSTTPSVGQRLSVLARSAEPLSAAPIIVFAQSGRPVAKAVAVRQPDGRYAVTFAVAAGGVGPATITVRGTDTGGGRNRSTTTVAVREA